MIRTSWTRRRVLACLAPAAVLLDAAGARAQAPQEAEQETKKEAEADSAPVAADSPPEAAAKAPPSDGWEYFTKGRIGAFVSWSKGDGMPQPTTFDLETGMERHKVQIGAGGSGSAVSSGYFKPKADGTPSMVRVSSIDSMRLRSGFTGNVIGFGAKRKLGNNTVTAYWSITSVVDSQSQKKYFLSVGDVREGYVKIEGSWGGFLAGRAGALFNRGAVTTDFLYLHGYGVGFPGDLNSSGGFPTAGQIGYGVLANGFAAGLVYSTPPLAGAQLSVGIYDPASLTGSNYERTKYPRGEFEMTVDRALGGLGKVHVYANGGYQINYQQDKSDADPRPLYGLGYGGRLELGPVHLGGGGHWGKGLGLAYPGLPGEPVYDSESVLKMTNGYFVMAQLALGMVDINAGYGRTNIEPTVADRTADPLNPFGDPDTSVLKSQTGISGAVVLHATEWLHFGVDVMYADSQWHLGEGQKILYTNAGTTVTW